MKNENFLTKYVDSSGYDLFLTKAVSIVGFCSACASA